MNVLEVYILCESRSAKLAERFLETFSPKRLPVAEEYPYPQYEQGAPAVFNSATELMQQLELDESESYSFYWNSIGNEICEQVMLFYLEDGSLIAGIGEPAREPLQVIQEMAKCVGGRFGFISSDSFPAESREEFIEICRSSALDSLYDGFIRRSDFA